MKKKIAIVDLLFTWPPDGGARTDVKEIAERLARDHDVCLFVPDMDYVFPRGRNAEAAGITVVKVPASPRNFTAWEFPNRLRAAVDGFAPDLVLFTDGWYMKTPVIRRFADKKYIIRFYAYEGLCLRQHGTFFINDKLCRNDYLGGGFEDWLECELCAVEWLARSKSKVFAQEYLASGAFLPSHKRHVIETLCGAAGIICYNDFIRQKLLPYNRNVHICPSGVDLDLFTYQQKKETDLLSKENIDILMVGRVSDTAKGYTTLRVAYDRLKPRYPQLRLMVTRETIYNRTDPDVITYDWLPQAKLPELYAQADICVVPSVWPEPFGIVALEAMASGVPVIVSRVGGLQRIVEHGKDGLVFPAGEAAALAEQLEMLITDKIRYERLRAAAGKSVKQYSWDAVFKKIAGAIGSLLA